MIASKLSNLKIQRHFLIGALRKHRKMLAVSVLYRFFKAILEGKIQFVDTKSISVLLDFYSDQSIVIYDSNTGMKFDKFFISTFVESSLYEVSG